MDNKKSTYKKVICGPGGINCPCCRHVNKKKAKRLNNRFKRRAQRQAFKIS